MAYPGLRWSGSEPEARSDFKSEDINNVKFSDINAFVSERSCIRSNELIKVKPAIVQPDS